MKTRSYKKYALIACLWVAGTVGAILSETAANAVEPTPVYFELHHAGNQV